MPLNFPSSPTQGQIYTSDNRTWIYSLGSWRSYNLTLNNVVDDSNTTRVFSLCDLNRYIRFTSTTPVTASVSADSTVSWPNGSEIYIRRANTGTVSLSAASSVSILNSAAAIDVPLYGVFSIKKITTDTWDLI